MRTSAGKGIKGDHSLFHYHRRFLGSSNVGGGPPEVVDDRLVKLEAILIELKTGDFCV